MRVLLDIPISNTYSTRSPRLNLKAFRFACALLAGAKFPPIHVKREPGGRYRILDGRHRFTAYKLIGRKHIKAHVGVRQEPNPYKPLRHGPEKPVRVSDQTKLEPTTWLHL